MHLARHFARQARHPLQLLAAGLQDPRRGIRSGPAVPSSLVGPTPGRSSRNDRVMALSRRPRWNSIANRCASSRMRWSSCSGASSWPMTSGLGRPGMNTSSIRLARLITVVPELGQVAQLLEPRAQLALAAVDHDQRRQRREALVVLLLVRRQLLLGAVLGHPPRQDLGHGGEVVLGGAADLEAAVVGLLRRPALEHHHRGHGVRLAQVGDVEALDPHRQLVHAQLLLEAVQRLDALVAAALGLQPVLVQRQPRVALGQLEDAPLVPALGRAHLHRPAALGGQRRLQRLTSSSPCGTTTRGGMAMALA